MSVANKDTLQEYAALIMAHLEDTHEIAVDIQGHDKSLPDMVTGFQNIRSNLCAMEKTVSQAKNLASKLNTQ